MRPVDGMQIGTRGLQEQVFNVSTSSTHRVQDSAWVWGDIRITTSGSVIVHRNGTVSPANGNIAFSWTQTGHASGTAAFNVVVVENTTGWQNTAGGFGINITGNFVAEMTQGLPFLQVVRQFRVGFNHLMFVSQPMF